MQNVLDLYRPSQPSVSYESKDYVSYQEIAPDISLRNYIYCYWQLRTMKELDHPFVYRVVSDGCIDILLELSKPEDMFITGFSSSYLEYELGNQFNYIGVRFLPTGFPLMFNIPASELTNNFFKLGEFLPQLSNIITSTIPLKSSLSQYKQVFDEHFLAILIKGTSLVNPDLRVFNAIGEILKSGGNADIKSLDVGLSERHLRRLFQFYFGESPKTFGQVVRFQNILRAKPSLESLKKNKIFYDAGYYDQAHFIKEFKNFYGVTPSKAFGRSE